MATQYSIFNWDTRRYDYYLGSGLSLGDIVTPTISGGATTVAIPESILTPLPNGVKIVGSGCKAKGRIAVLQNEQIVKGLAGDENYRMSNTLAISLICITAGIGTLLYYWIQKK